MTIRYLCDKRNIMKDNPNFNYRIWCPPKDKNAISCRARYSFLLIFPVSWVWQSIDMWIALVRVFEVELRPAHFEL